MLIPCPPSTACPQALSASTGDEALGPPTTTAKFGVVFGDVGQSENFDGDSEVAGDCSQPSNDFYENDCHGVSRPWTQTFNLDRRDLPRSPPISSPAHRASPSRHAQHTQKLSEQHTSLHGPFLCCQTRCAGVLPLYANLGSVPPPSPPLTAARCRPPWPRRTSTPAPTPTPPPRPPARASATTTAAAR